MIMMFALNILFLMFSHSKFMELRRRPVRAGPGRFIICSLFFLWLYLFPSVAFSLSLLFSLSFCVSLSLSFCLCLCSCLLKATSIHSHQNFVLISVLKVVLSPTILELLVVSVFVSFSLSLSLALSLFERKIVCRISYSFLIKFVRGYEMHTPFVPFMLDNRMKLQYKNRTYR